MEDAVVGIRQSGAVRTVQVVENLPASLMPGAQDFVVSAPQGKGRVVPKSEDVFSRFFFHVGGKLIVVGDHGTSKHEILPNQQAVSVTSIEKAIGWINASAPNANHVHVGCEAILDQAGPAVATVYIVKIRWNHVGASCKDAFPIDNRRKRRSPLILDLLPV